MTRTLPASDSAVAKAIRDLTNILDLDSLSAGRFLECIEDRAWELQEKEETNDY